MVKVMNESMEAIEVYKNPADAAEYVTENRCYNVEELAIILGISKGTVYRLLEQREFHWLKIGTAIRIPRKGFDEWLNGKL